MVDFVTPNLSYVAPEVGGSVNTWGDKLNDNIEKQDTDISARVLRGGDSMQGALGWQAGTEALPGLFAVGDSDTGLYSPAANMVGITTGGVGRFILSNTLLSLGVGLMVSGSTALSSVAYTGTLTGGTGIINLGSGQLYKSAAGLVGIGTTTPNRQLVVNGSGNTSFVQVTNSDTGVNAADGGYFSQQGLDTYVVNQETANLILGTSNAERLRIDSVGNVGIGTTAPAYRLDVAGPVARVRSVSAFSGLLLSSGDPNASTRNWLVATNFNAFGDFVINQSNAQGGDPILAGTTRFAISQAGNLLVGTTTEPTGNPRLFVFNGSAINTVTSYFTTGASDSNFRLGFRNGSGSSVATEQAALSFDYLGSKVGYIGFNRGGGADCQAITFGTNGSGSLLEHGRFTGAGNLLVGTTASLGAGIHQFQGALVAGNTNTPDQRISIGGDINGPAIGTVGDNAPIRFITLATERARITSAGDFIKTVNTTAPTLTVNNTMTTSLPNNTTLRFHVRGSDGVTRTSDLTLA